MLYLHTRILFGPLTQVSFPIIEFASLMPHLHTSTQLISSYFVSHATSPMPPASLTTARPYHLKTERNKPLEKPQCMLSPKKPKSPPEPLRPVLHGISAANAGDGVFARLFRCVDTDGDGKISAPELQVCVRRLVGDDVGDEEARSVVAMHDSDGDGLLCFDDFVRLMVGGNEGEKEEEEDRRLREAFKVYEMEGEDCITPKSLRRTLGRLGENWSIEECGFMIRRYDANGDGVLSFDEFRVMML